MSLPLLPESSECPSRWVSRHTYLQISHTHVLPILFKSRALTFVSSQSPQNPPPAFPETEVKLYDAMHLIQDWILHHLDRIYRQTPANLKPGTLETPDVSQNSAYQFTIWLEPTAATSALVVPGHDQFSSHNYISDHACPLARQGDKFYFHSFRLTPQTLHVTAELALKTTQILEKS